MPLLRGTLAEHALARRIGDKPVTELEVADWAIQCLRGLADLLHARNVVHRDIKPSNLLLDDQRGIVIANFGVARDVERASDLTRTGDVVGSDLYMADEQRQRAATVTGKADVFALARTLHEVLTGKYSPLAGKGVAGKTGDILRRMGAQDPDDRPTASEAEAAFSKILAELRPASAPATGPAAPESAGLRKYRAELKAFLTSVDGLTDGRKERLADIAETADLDAAVCALVAEHLARDREVVQFAKRRAEVPVAEAESAGKLVEAAEAKRQAEAVQLEAGRFAADVARKEWEAAESKRVPLVRLTLTAQAGKYGVMLTEAAGYCRVKEVVAGGAAERGGMRVGDLVVTLDDLSCQGLRPPAIATMLQGALEHTVVVLRPAGSSILAGKSGADTPKTRDEGDAMPNFDGAADRFVDCGDGTVADKLRGLVWQQGDLGKDLNWADAKGYAKSLKLGGQVGWRLPTIAELGSLVDDRRPFGEKNAAVFRNGDRGFWSCTLHPTFAIESLYEQSAREVWSVDFYLGKRVNDPVTFDYRVRCVRTHDESPVAYGTVKKQVDKLKASARPRQSSVVPDAVQRNIDATWARRLSLIAKRRSHVD